jgi:probable phosphoglycerate mutase
VAFVNNMEDSRADPHPPGETRVLLIRHAESAAPDRFHGAESDIGLGSCGRAQAKHLARCLATLRPDALVSSPMRRARETAAAIAQTCRLPVEIAPELHERRMGALSGLRKDEGWDWYAQEKGHWKAGNVHYTREGGETFAEVSERAVSALRGLVGRLPNKRIVVVAHGVLIKITLATLLEELGPEDFDRIGIDTTAVNDLRWDGSGWSAAALNVSPELVR